MFKRVLLLTKSYLLQGNKPPFILFKNALATYKVNPADNTVLILHK